MPPGLRPRTIPSRGEEPGGESGRPLSVFVNLIHGAALAGAVVLAYVSAFYGWAWAESWWSDFHLDGMGLFLWSVSLTGWLGFSILGNVKVVQREDEGRTTDRWGRGE